ncbi:MAG: hypothetical protein CVV09_13605 [Gammaproteobacteria bacterium HGW-Gammaproteobacteria-13]|nr:MAG: hypothetical protein CVV09_13605 [Gammaproteobacteria bacterium HGW-Gammaproteobacteria-13]
MACSVTGCALRPDVNRQPVVGRRGLEPYLRSRELEPCKAKIGEEAEFTGVNEHSEPVFNAAGPTRSRS